MIEPNYRASADFLQKWRPGGPWILTAIEPDSKGIETQTIKTLDDVVAWLQEAGSARNIYFHVNPALKDLDKKAARWDVEALAWLHVDIDPRAGEDLAGEQARALNLLRNPPNNIPGPTAIVFSGGGYQGFWRLKDPMPINGKEELFEAAKLYNVQLEVTFGADNCHNVDRIMRLPGTVNRPNDRKRKKGRVEALAKLVEWNAERSYLLSEFTPAPKIQTTDNGFSGNQVRVSGNIKRYGSIDDLPEKVRDRTKALILHGEDPIDATKYESRSEALFAVCCELVRAGLSDDDIYSVITDPDFEISRSVLEKGRASEKYAVRQIERAREEAIDPWLRKINEVHAVIGDIGGKCRVISELEEHIGTQVRSKISLQSFQDFRNRYMNVQIECGTKKDGQAIYIPLGAWWLGHQSRRQYETMSFAPGREIPGVYNLWRGFAVEAIPGDCQLFIDHVLVNLCGKNTDHFNYLMGWMAMSVQHPDQPGHSAVVLRGDQGTGKGFFAKTIGSLFGRHYMQISDPKHLVGSFNAHLRDCVICFADEAFYAGDKNHESVLKSMVTEETLSYEPKGYEIQSGANYLHLIMASNNDWVVPAGFNERRFFVLDVEPTEMQNTSYFRAIQSQLDTGGREALLHRLRTYPLKDFDVRKIPSTIALREQKMFGMSPEQGWWFEKLRDGQVFHTHIGWEKEICTQELVEDYIAYTRRFNVSRRGTSTRLGQFMQKVCPEMTTHQKRTPLVIETAEGRDKTLRRPYYYVIGSLAKMRDHWDKHFGGPYEWNNVTTPELETPAPF